MDWGKGHIWLQHLTGGKYSRPRWKSHQIGTRRAGIPRGTRCFRFDLALPLPLPSRKWLSARLGPRLARGRHSVADVRLYLGISFDICKVHTHRLSISVQIFDIFTCICANPIRIRIRIGIIAPLAWGSQPLPNWPKLIRLDSGAGKCYLLCTNFPPHFSRSTLELGIRNRNRKSSMHAHRE